MSSSTSNLPAIIVAVVVILLLVVFYVADRSSGGSDMTAITHTADTEQMISSKAKYETHKSVFSHSGYSGSMEGYLEHTGKDANDDKILEEHKGYTGSGKEYIKHQREKEETVQKHNANEHRGYSGSLDDYLAGNYDQRKSEDSPKPASEHKTTKKGSDDGYSGSIDQYLKKYGS